MRPPDPSNPYRPRSKNQYFDLANVLAEGLHTIAGDIAEYVLDVGRLRKVVGAAEALLGARAIGGLTSDDWALLERAVAEATQRPARRDAGSA